MQRCAVFVDAGYLLTEGARLLSGSRQSRETLSLDIPMLVTELRRAAKDACSLPLLRIYWYDAARHRRATAEQTALAETDDIKLRLGHVNANGEQKGVDALLMTDLAELARNRAIADAVLVSGDEDLALGVLAAQQHGVRVHLVGIRADAANQSRALLQEADTTLEWDRDLVARFLTCTSPATDIGEDPPEAALAGLVRELPPELIERLKNSFLASSTIPADLDWEILRIGRERFGGELTVPQRHELRAGFIRLVKSVAGADIPRA